MNYKIFYLILSSSLLLNFSLFFTKTFFFGVFLFLIPIYYLVLKKYKISFKEGVLWGILFWSIHFYYLFILINEYGNGFFRELFIVFLVLYFSLYSGLWFYLISKTNLFLATVLYFFIINYFSLVIFGRLEGYPFANPLLPLIEYKCFLGALNIYTEIIFLLLLTLFSFFIANFIVLKKIKFLIFSIIIFSLFFLQFPIKKEKRIDSRKIGCIVINKNISTYPYEAAKEVMSQLSFLLKKPSVKIIILPESSFSFALNLYPKVIEMLYENEKLKDIDLLIGSHKQEGKNLYNCLYHIKNKQILHCYKKRHLMVFTEELPLFFNNFQYFKKLFLDGKKEFTKNFDKRSTININNNIFVPYICSDLFFLNENIQNNILSISNDSWFKSYYFRNLLFLIAKYKAKKYSISILYISHSKACYL